MVQSYRILPALAVLGIVVAAALLVRSSGSAGQPPICDAGGPYAGLAGFPVEFDGTASTDPDGTIVLYEWQFGDGATGSGPTPSHTYDQPRLFTAILTVTDDMRLASSCSTMVLIGVDHKPPSCDAGGPYTGMAGHEIQFDGTNSMAIPPHVLIAYAWDFGDGGTGTGPTPTHSYVEAGVFMVSLEVMDDTNQVSVCQTTASIAPVTVEPTTWGAIKKRAHD